ncbi:transposase [Streptomyces sp. NPDC054775]
MVDAVRYLVAGGITWRAMPADFPAWDRVYAFWRRWRDKGLIIELHKLMTLFEIGHPLLRVAPDLLAIPQSGVT